MKVALIMGSISDEEIVKKSAAVLKDFSVEYLPCDFSPSFFESYFGLCGEYGAE